MTGREGNEKSKFHFTKAVVRWQLLRCRTVKDEHHCLAGARGHGAADRQLLLLPSRYSESTHSLPTFCSVWPCLPRLQTQLLGHWSRTKRVGQFGRGRLDVSLRRLAQRSVLEIMSLYAVFVCNVCMLQTTVPLGLSIKMMHYGGEKKSYKNLIEWLLQVLKKSSNKLTIYLTYLRTNTLYKNEKSLSSSKRWYCICKSMCIYTDSINIICNIYSYTLININNI